MCLSCLPPMWISLLTHCVCLRFVRLFVFFCFFSSSSFLCVYNLYDFHNKINIRMHASLQWLQNSHHHLHCLYAKSTISEINRSHQSDSELDRQNSDLWRDVTSTSGVFLIKYLHLLKLMNMLNKSFLSLTNLSLYERGLRKWRYMSQKYVTIYWNLTFKVKGKS